MNQGALQVPKCPLATYHRGILLNFVSVFLYLVVSSFSLLALELQILLPLPHHLLPLTLVPSPILCFSSSVSCHSPTPTKVLYSRGPWFSVIDPHSLEGTGGCWLPWNRKQNNLSVSSVIKILLKICPTDTKKQNCEHGFLRLLAGFPLPGCY